MTTTEKLIDAEINLPDKIGILAAVVRRDDLLTECRLLPAVIPDARGANLAGFNARRLQTQIKFIRELAKAERDPLNAVCKKIIEAENEHCSPLEVELVKINATLTEYADAERRRVEAEEKYRREAIEAAERQRVAAERAAQAELERAQAEIAAENAKAQAEDAGIMTEADLAARIGEESCRQRIANQREYEAHLAVETLRGEAEAAKRAAMTRSIPEAHKVAGTTGRKVVCWRVTDEKALLKARQDLFTRPEIKPSAIRAVCFPNSLDASVTKPDNTSVPGLSLWYEWQISSRKF